jgi:hypothetical protein
LFIDLATYLLAPFGRLIERAFDCLAAAENAANLEEM